MTPTPESIIFAITSEAKHASDFTADELALACVHLNAEYRAGRPIVDDATYDQVFLAALRVASPQHPFLHSVEPEAEGTFDAPTVRHERPFLSTAKAYSQDEIDRYLAQVEKAAKQLGLEADSLEFRVTAKLDGIAGNDDGHRLVTRGDGTSGSDITYVIERGLIPEGGRGQGRGELVVEASFFDEQLGKGTEHDMDHARNFVAGFCGADVLKAHHRLAIENQALRFVPFTLLPQRIVRADILRQQWGNLYDELTSTIPYYTDGIVVEVTGTRLREVMGATSHHERAVLAIKRQGEARASTVTGIRLTTGRTGRIIPTLLIEPVVLSGATVSKATAHTAANLKARGLGPGAVATFVRSGEVIPKLIDILSPAEVPTEVTHCPSCGHQAVEDGEHMLCPNTQGCTAQAESRLRHFFHTMGNVDLFGPETVSRLVEAEITDLRDIYAMNATGFENLGFGPGQAANLVAQLERSLRQPVAHWRFLASFGIKHLGRGDSRKLLEYFSFEELGFLTAEQIESVPGFGPKTSPAIAASLQESWSLITDMRSLGFQLEQGRVVAAEGAKLAGELVVFTGTMEQGKRSDMEALARTLGAEVQSAVNAKTTLLVAGAKAGSKIKKAQANNDKAGQVVTRILSEAEYMAEIADQQSSPTERVAVASAS